MLLSRSTSLLSCSISSLHSLELKLKTHRHTHHSHYTQHPAITKYYIPLQSEKKNPLPLAILTLPPNATDLSSRLPRDVALCMWPLMVLSSRPTSLFHCSRRISTAGHRSPSMSCFLSLFLSWSSSLSRSLLTSSGMRVCVFWTQRVNYYSLVLTKSNLRCRGISKYLTLDTQDTGSLISRKIFRNMKKLLAAMQKKAESEYSPCNICICLCWASLSLSTDRRLCVKDSIV